MISGAERTYLRSQQLPQNKLARRSTLLRREQLMTALLHGHGDSALP